MALPVQGLLVHGTSLSLELSAPASSADACSLLSVTDKVPAV